MGKTHKTIGPEVELNLEHSCYEVTGIVMSFWSNEYGSAVQVYLVPETRVVEPFEELLAHDHGAGEEGPVRQQEVFDIGGVHHWVFLHQMHGKTLCCALFKIVVAFDNLYNLIYNVQSQPSFFTLMTMCPFLVPVRSSSRCSFTITISPSSSTFCMFFSTWLRMQQ